MTILIPILQGLRLFDQLPTDKLAQVAQTMSERRVERREVIIKRGETDAGLGFLIEGRLQAVNFTLDGKEVGADFIGNGDFFGELSVIDGRPAPEYIIAVAPSRVVFLEREQARELMFSTPRGAEAVATRLAERLRRAASHRALLALPSSFQRVCAQLALLSQASAKDGVVISMPPSVGARRRATAFTTPSTRRTDSGVRSSYISSSTRAQGALSQAARHSIQRSVKLPVGSVSPTLQPSSFSRAAMTPLAPLSSQGKVRQSQMTCAPGFVVKNIV